MAAVTVNQDGITAVTVVGLLSLAVRRSLYDSYLYSSSSVDWLAKPC